MQEVPDRWWPSLYSGSGLVPTVFIAVSRAALQQFALTIAISVHFSGGFNALSLSPALSALLLKHREPTHGRWPGFRLFNRVFGQVTNNTCIGARDDPPERLSLVLLAGWRRCLALGANCPPRFLPRRPGICLYQRATAQRGSAHAPPYCKRVEEFWRRAGCQVLHDGGFSLLSRRKPLTTHCFFCTAPWERSKKAPNNLAPSEN